MQEQHEKAAAREINAYKTQAHPKDTKRESRSEWEDETKAVKFSATHSTHPLSHVCVWVSHLVQHSPLGSDEVEVAQDQKDDKTAKEAQAGWQPVKLVSLFFFCFLCFFFLRDCAISGMWRMFALMLQPLGPPPPSPAAAPATLAC